MPASPSAPVVPTAKTARVAVADIIITKVEFYTNPIKAGNPFGAKVTFKNIGTAKSGPFYMRVMPSAFNQGGYAGKFELEPGKETEWLTGGMHSTTPGTFPMRYIVDSKNEILESDKTNNTFDTSFTIVPNVPLCGGLPVTLEPGRYIIIAAAGMK